MSGGETRCADETDYDGGVRSPPAPKEHECDRDSRQHNLHHACDHHRWRQDVHATAQVVNSMESYCNHE